jgi:hypothetical protein
MRFKQRILLTALYLGFVAASSARAECIVVLGPCHEFKMAAAVFDGTVEQSEPISIDDHRQPSVVAVAVAGRPADGHRARVRVNRAWKGVSAGGVLDVFGDDTGYFDTFVNLSVGRRYLFYARRDAQGRLWAQACGRTLRLEEATADIAHLDDERTRAGGSVFGGVVLDGTDGSRTQPSGVVIILEGPGHVRQTRTTNHIGSFSFDGLAPGPYSVRVEANTSFSVVDGTHTFIIQDKRECEYVSFRTRAVAR